MKKVIVCLVILVLVVIVFSLVWRTAETGHAVSSGSSGSSGSSSSVKAGNACAQMPFDSDPNAFACGKGCCFSSQTCYEGQVCCDRATETGDHIPPSIIYFCKKTCDTKKGQIECGDVCCNPGEACKKQGMVGKYHGTCLKPEQVQTGCDIATGETPCTNEKGELFECCAANQECKSKKIGLILKVTIRGCSVKKDKAGGCGADTFCQGAGKDFKEYAVCCKNPGEACALHPDGQPYCYPAKQLPAADTKKTVGFIEQIRLFFGWS